MITPTKKNLAIYQGSTFILDHIVKDTAGLVVDLTDATLQSQIRESKASYDVVLDLTATNSLYIINPLTGEIRIKIAPIDTASFDIEKAVYDLEVHFQNGDVYRALEGSVFVSLEVTRS